MQVQQHAEAQARADAERAALSETVHKLGRELARLEAFKRNLLHSLQAADQVGAWFLVNQQPCHMLGSNWRAMWCSAQMD